MKSFRLLFNQEGNSIGSPFSWNYNDYSVTALHDRSQSELRAEYSRLRSIANKRIYRLSKSEFSDSEIYKQFRKGFKPLTEMKGQQLLYNLNAVMRFLASKGSSITGQKEIRKQSIEKLHEHGYSFVDASNFRAFTGFMESVRAAAQNARISSEEVAEFFEEHTKIGSAISAENLQQDFYNYLEEM